MKARIIGGTAVAAASLAASMGMYFEGVFPVGYEDPVGIPTDCIGETGPDVAIGKQRFTMEQCIARYPVRLQGNWRQLERCIFVPVTLHQAGSLMSFSDNTGIRATCTSTMVRLLNAGAPPNQWCAQMRRWKYGTILGVKVVLAGLVTRRKAEEAMCMGRDWRDAIGLDT